MPLEWKKRYLLKQTRGLGEPVVFNLAKQLQTTTRILVTWPDRTEDMLIAVPAVKALREALGERVAWTHLAEAGLQPFLAGLFPAVPLVIWDRESLAWHEPAIQNALSSIRAFNPDTALTLSQPYPPVLQALIKASGAGLRITIDEHADMTYSNIAVIAESGSPLAARYFQPLGLWRYAGLNVRDRWMRLQPTEGQRRVTQDLWAAAKAAPEQTWLYFPGAGLTRVLNSEFHAWLCERIRARETGSFRLGLLEWASHAPGDPMPDSIHREGAWLEAPLFRAGTLGELLGILDAARGVTAFQGPGLHFASLAEVNCLALLNHDEAAYDVSPWNPMVSVSWL